MTYILDGLGRVVLEAPDWRPETMMHFTVGRRSDCHAGCRERLVGHSCWWDAWAAVRAVYFPHEFEPGQLLMTPGRRKWGDLEPGEVIGRVFPREDWRPTAFSSVVPETHRIPFYAFGLETLDRTYAKFDCVRGDPVAAYSQPLSLCRLWGDVRAIGFDAPPVGAQGVAIAQHEAGVPDWFDVPDDGVTVPRWVERREPLDG